MTRKLYTDRDVEMVARTYYDSLYGPGSWDNGCAASCPESRKRDHLDAAQAALDVTIDALVGAGWLESATVTPGTSSPRAEQ